MQVSIGFNPSGPIWDKKDRRVVAVMTTEMRRELAQEALQHIIGLTSVFKKPTGRYRRHLTVFHRVNSDLITDQEIAYGPWLEWGGRGNFDGYGLWEKTFLWAQRSADRILDDKANEITRRLN